MCWKRIIFTYYYILTLSWFQFHSNVHNNNRSQWVYVLTFICTMIVYIHSKTMKMFRICIGFWYTIAYIQCELSAYWNKMMVRIIRLFFLPTFISHWNGKLSIFDKNSAKSRCSCFNSKEKIFRNNKTIGKLIEKLFRGKKAIKSHHVMSSAVTIMLCEK